MKFTPINSWKSGNRRSRIDDPRNISLVVRAANSVAGGRPAHASWHRADKQRQFDVAITEFRKVTELEPAFADGFISLGQAYMEKHDFGSATVSLKHALELNPESTPAHQLLGYALLVQGYAAQAIPHLERAKEKSAVGIAQIQTGQLAEAVVNLQAALASTPTIPTSLLPRPRQWIAVQTID